METAEEIGAITPRTQTESGEFAQLNVTISFLERRYEMQIAHQANNEAFTGSRLFDGWIMLGYSAFAVVLLAAIHLASAGSGLAGEEIAILSVLP
ncbi:hypothetical protein [Bradyrhizobium niftali]|uniref:Uncharacterized protein n=1 Tax=Bradyrhizobium niftali TaxID=2560055 RepID=A0A4Y9KWY9_9BRAD|nr:hypothetical protein [Bradyrhizobium niftali]TFV35868.1 hypothetical protein E4K65_46165 [Bradyrhizobium niftali]